jgi:hypothetical protein
MLYADTTYLCPFFDAAGKEGFFKVEERKSASVNWRQHSSKVATSRIRSFFCDAVGDTTTAAGDAATAAVYGSW